MCTQLLDIILYIEPVNALLLIKFVMNKRDGMDPAAAFAHHCDDIRIGRLARLQAKKAVDDLEVVFHPMMYFTEEQLILLVGLFQHLILNRYFGILYR